MHMCFTSTGILSPSGDVRPFSKGADGTLLGEGVGMLILKRLESAIDDQDRVYAVIKGVGTSSDGKSQSIYAPNQQGQAKALRKAYQMAQINPNSVELLEAHGTGTRVGDKVEFQALQEVYQNHDAGMNGRKQWCALGSVKSMLGQFPIRVHCRDPPRGWPLGRLLVTAATTSRPITRNTARCVPLQVRVGSLSLRPGQASSPVRLCNRRLGRRRR